MKKKKLRPRQTVELLTPLIEFTTIEQCSVSSLKTGSTSLSKKIKMSDAPIRLTHNGITIALMCDPSVYVRLEQRRRELVALLENAPHELIPAVGHRRTHPFAQPNIQELKRHIAKKEGLNRRITSQKCGLYDLEEELQETDAKIQKLWSGLKNICLPTE